MSLIQEHGDEAIEVFKESLQSYQLKHDESSFETIETMVLEARKIAEGNTFPAVWASSLARKALKEGNYSQEAQRKADTIQQAFLILGVWDTHEHVQKDMRLRILDTGKTEEQLKNDDEELSRKRKQGEAWRAQGLCYWCGGQLGMFKKCKSCGLKS